MPVAYWLICLCVWERALLVCVCVYVGMEPLVAPFLLFTQQPAFRHVCVFADWARWLTHRKNRSTCLCSTYFPQCVFFRHQNMFGRLSKGKARGSESFFHGGPVETNPVGVMSPSQFLPFFSVCKYSNFLSDWRIHDVSGTSYICLDRVEDYLPRWCHLFTKLIPNT